MPYDNSVNTAKGRLFQEQACRALTKRYGIEFLKDYPVQIGNPPKEHKFDLVSKDGKYIAECKCYTWTETGNIPDAKMAKCDQTILYLTHAPAKSRKLLVMKKDLRPSKEETLAKYYKRTHHHLIEDITIVEFDPKTQFLTEV